MPADLESPLDPSQYAFWQSITRIRLNGFNLASALDEVTVHASRSQLDEPDDLEHALLMQTPAPAAPATHVDDTQDPPQSARNRKRANKRRQAVESRGHSASSRTIFEHVQLSDDINLSYNAFSMPAARGAFSALQLGGSKAENEKEYGLADLEALGFRVVEWDGVDPMPLTDSEGRIIAALAGRPRDPTYAQACQNFFMKVQEARGLEKFTNDETIHRRGIFPALPFGISYGNGQTKPQRLSSGSHGALITSLLEDRDLHRMANYADAAFQLWAPRLYAHYQGVLQSVEKATGCTRNFPGIAFACATLNLGPQVRTFKHRDSLNLPYGLCAIQSIGDFNPKLGGHLILWDLRLVIEFPPYSTILIPSACLTHSNVPVQGGEYRLSFTQYSAGGLFRWVSNSCMTESELKVQDKDLYDSQMQQKPKRWLESLKLFSTYKELTSCI